jgi:Beta-lactamase superfamily domain
MTNNSQKRGGSRWFGYPWHGWRVEGPSPIAPAFARPNPAEWNDNRITAAWLSHATVLINFFGSKILTDPILFPRIGIRLPGLTLGPKRLTAPALTVRDLPTIDIILLSHAHFDHFDMHTLHRFDRLPEVITAPRTSDLLSWKRFRNVSELRWKEQSLSQPLLERSPSPRSASNIGVRASGAIHIAVTTATSSRATIGALSSAAIPP